MTSPEPVVRHLGCPACGATLARREDQRVVLCRNCGNRSLLTGVPVVRRYQAVPRVDRDEAIRTVRGCLAQWPVREGTAQRAAVLAADLYYVPFVEFEALQAGTVRRTEGTRVARGGRVDWSTGSRRFLDPAGREIPEHEYYRRRTVEDVDTCVVLRTHRAAEPAGTAEEWGIAALDPSKLRQDPDLRFVPLGSPDAPPGHVLPPRHAHREMEDRVRAAASVVGEVRVDFLASDLRYVFLPVWVVRYRVERHPYAFVVDGLHGRVLSGRAPEAPRRGTLFLLLGAAFIGFPLGKVVGAVGVGGAGEATGSFFALLAELLLRAGPVALILPAILLLPIAYAWGEFRFRGEVVFSPEGPRVEKLSRPAMTTLERLIDWFGRAFETAMRNARDR